MCVCVILFFMCSHILLTFSLLYSCVLHLQVRLVNHPKTPSTFFIKMTCPKTVEMAQIKKKVKHVSVCLGQIFTAEYESL